MGANSHNGILMSLLLLGAETTVAVTFRNSERTIFMKKPFKLYEFFFL